MPPSRKAGLPKPQAGSSCKKFVIPGPKNRSPATTPVKDRLTKKSWFREHACCYSKDGANGQVRGELSHNKLACMWPNHKNLNDTLKREIDLIALRETTRWNQELHGGCYIVRAQSPMHMEMLYHKFRSICPEPEPDVFHATDWTKPLPAILRPRI